jgi:NADH-quinone oxidoreductase subunit K
MVTTSHYLVLSLILFALGIVAMVVRRNFITVLMGVELILNAANINFLAFSHQRGDLTGQIFAVFVIAVAAAEAAIGLGIIIALVRLKHTLNLDTLDELEG